MFHEKAYTRLEKYNNASLKKHLDHVTRIKAPLIQNPRPPVIVGRQEFLDKLYDPQRGRQKNSTLVAEEVVSGYMDSVDIEKTEKIREFLQHYLNREVVAVIHTDESELHAHFLFEWNESLGKDEKGKERTKALRIDKRKIIEIQKGICSITGQTVEYGTGRRRISLREYRVDPNAIDRAKQHDEQVKGYVAEFLKLYPKMKIVYLSEQGRLKNSEYVLEKLEGFKIRQAFALNNRGFNVAIEPGEEANAILVDDIPEKSFEKLPKGSLIVGTSPGKYQAHIPIPEGRYKDRQHRKTYQRIATAYLEGDPGSIDGNHLRKLPGFKNRKYKEDTPEIKFKGVKADGQEPTEFFNLILRLERERKDRQERQQQRISEVKSLNQRLQEKTLDTGEYKGLWEYFLRRIKEQIGRPDRSMADFRMAI